MSFSSKVKEELKKIVPNNGHCMQAQAEARKYFTLVKKKYTISSEVLERRCCKRAFLRESFLIAGSITDPEKGYHFDITSPDEEKVSYIRDIINTFDGMDAKVLQRRGYYIVYLKGSDQIVDMLGIMEASLAYMELENIRIFKEMRNTVNRRVNCETANIGKTVNASKKQTDDILKIKEKTGFKDLPEGLAEMAQVRLEHPEASLTELGRYLDPPIGKSGVNHRLRKLTAYAEKLVD